MTRAALFNPSEFIWRFADRLGALLLIEPEILVTDEYVAETLAS